MDITKLHKMTDQSDLPSIALILSLITTVSYFSGLLLYRIFFHPLRRVPGPFIAKFTYGYHIYYDAFRGGSMPKKMPGLHQKYGPIVRIAPDRVHINDPDFYKRMFGPREDFTKSKYYYGNLGISESIVTMQDVKAHRVLRNALNPFFTPQTAIDQQPMVLQEIEKLLYDLRRPSSGPVLIDLQATMGQLFTKFTTRATFGLNDLSDDDAFTIFNGISSWFATFNWLLAFPIVPKVALMIPDWLTGNFVPGYMVIRQMVGRCVAQCKARMKGAEKFAQYNNVFDMLQEADLGGHKLNETQLLHEAIELLAGGVLPTNIAATYAAYNIITYPQVLYALKEELAGLSKTDEGIPIFEHLTDVPYLAAIIKETLRLRPAAGPGFLPRTVPQQGVLIGNTFIPGGTNISTSIYTVGTSPLVFKDPLAFNPNRWLGPKAAELEDWFVSFSKGPRQCLGKHIAMLSIANVIASIFSNFQVMLHETDNNTMDWRDQTLLVNAGRLKAYIKPLPPTQTPKEFHLVASDLEKGLSGAKTSSPLSESDTVIIPDLFVDWAANPIKLNPHYWDAVPKAEQWFKEVCKHDQKTHQKYVKADFGYFSGFWVPDVGPDEFTTTIDYCNWVWAFDDPFDEGSMKNDPVQIQKAADQLMSIMSDNPPNFKPNESSQPYIGVLYTFQRIWQRHIARCGKSTQDRFRQHQKDYLREVLEQADAKIFDKYTDLDTFCALHRESVGSKPLLPLIESCYGIDIPAYVFEDPGIQRIIDLQAELILLSNDLYSYAREAKAKHYDGHNVIHILRRNGMTQQEASDAIGIATVDRYKEWDDVVANLPSWGPEVDALVAKYVELSRGTVIANIEWSFQSKRYFGSKNDEVRKTRRIPAVPYVVPTIE